jgi:hypothetical protein
MNKKVPVVAAIRKTEHGVNFGTGKRSCIPWTQHGYKHRHNNFSFLWCPEGNSTCICRWATLYAALHPKQRTLCAVITSILYSLAGNIQSSETSRADLRPVHHRSYSTAATLPYTKLKSAYSFLHMLGAFPCNEITPAKPCKQYKRIQQLQECQFSATALNSVKVTAQLNSRVETTSG